MTVQLRQARPDDHPAIADAIGQWWLDSRSADQASGLALLVPRLFVEHFGSTSMIAERSGVMVGFLIGFYSQDHDNEAYIHFVGVEPSAREVGVARTMYEAFFTRAAETGRTTIRAVTSPHNTGSIAFHQHLGFEATHPDADHAGQERPRVRLTKKLD